MHIRVILCVFLLLFAAAASSQPAPTPVTPDQLTQAQIGEVDSAEVLMRLAATYKQAGDYQRMGWVLEQLLAMRPNSSDLRLALATTYAMQGQQSRTYDTLLKLQQVGYGVDLADNPNFAKVAGTKVWTYIVDQLKSNLKPFGEGKVAFDLPGGDHLYDSIAWDPKREQFLVGSVRDGTVLRVDAKGNSSPLVRADAGNGLWSVYALAVDTSSDSLYVASTSSVYFKGFTQQDYGKAGVFRFSLTDGKLLDKYLLESDGPPQTLSSIAVGPHGKVFAADGLRNIIYRLDGSQLKPLLANPKLTSLRGMAVGGDGRFLYFADYVMGVFGVDLAAGRAFDVHTDPAKLALGGIDGLSWYDNHLVAIQSGMSPRRVMRLALSADGRTVIGATPLDAAQPAFALPTYGTVAGNFLYFIANSQKNEYDGYGNPKDVTKLKPVEIFRTDLRFGWDASKHESISKADTVISKSKPGAGTFSNVEGGSTSVTGN
ncbi:MAG: hypothetical protein KIS89_06445 [Dokdonella sp.]|uniref:hypothetical protein n=1 Tax=Dokdonella sp. TaxID=2291710 RepID=UPI0027B8A9D1|nr:hypothetical protein [Dokdonella sp.]MCW5578261.1 hypothetical protein [Dokdonella sp.]